MELILSILSGVVCVIGLGLMGAVGYTAVLFCQECGKQERKD